MDGGTVDQFDENSAGTQARAVVADNRIVHFNMSAAAVALRRLVSWVGMSCPPGRLLALPRPLCFGMARSAHTSRLVRQQAQQQEGGPAMPTYTLDCHYTGRELFAASYLLTCNGKAVRSCVGAHPSCAMHARQWIMPVSFL